MGIVSGVTDAPLDLVATLAALDDSRAGAVVTFLGVVRDHDAGRSVVGIDYSAHPLAADELAAIAAEVAARPGVHGVALRHRVGRLIVGDAALLAVVTAEHRAEAIDGCRDAVEEVKRRVPIWKRQAFADGTSEWSNLP